MELFSYVAINEQGKQIKGTYEAKEREEVLEYIKSENLTAVEIKHGSILNQEINISFLDKKPTVRDLSVFCRQFVSIINAGVPVSSAFEMLSEQTENKMLKNALNECKLAIQSGSALSEAMSNHKKIFSSLFITMVEAGEVSGSLDVAFTRMAKQFENDAKLKKLVRKATVYPATILVIATIVVALLLAFVIPQFESMLTDLGSNLPLITVIVIALSDFIIEFWYIVIAAIIGIVVGLRVYGMTTSGKYTYSAIQLKIPLIKNLAIKTASAMMCRTMSTLLAAGIPIIEAIEIVSNTMQNIFFKDALISAKEDVAMGSTFSEPLSKSGLFPPMVRHMIKIGEEVGDIEAMMDKTADYYEEEVEDAVQSVMAVLEPLIIVVLALIVGSVVMAVMLPMMETMNSLGNL